MLVSLTAPSQWLGSLRYGSCVSFLTRNRHCRRIHLVKPYKNQEEVTMVAKETQVRQLDFVFVDATLWNRMPEKNRQRCRELLIQLLVEVVHEETMEGGENDE